MASAIVKGRLEDPGERYTFVPDGVTVQVFHAETVCLDWDGPILALLDDAAPGVPLEGRWIKNYTLCSNDDGLGMEWYALAERSDVPLWLIGPHIPDGTSLCAEEALCRSHGIHTCSGVLGTVAGSYIAIVEGRGWLAQKEKHKTDPLQIAALARDYVAAFRSGDDARVRQAEEDVDTVPGEVLDAMLQDADFGAWHAARMVAVYAEVKEIENMVGYLRAQVAPLDTVMWWLEMIPSYGRHLDQLAQDSPGDLVARIKEPDDDHLYRAMQMRPAIAQLLADAASAEDADPATY